MQEKGTKLRKDKNLFILPIVTLTTIFLLIEFFVFALISLKDMSLDKQNSKQIIVYISQLEENEKKEFSKKLLQLPNVESIRYESKEVALKAAILELGVEVNENENPLEDAFFVYINKDANLEQMKDSFLNMKEITAIDFRSKALENASNFDKGIEALSTKITTILSVIGIIMIYSVMVFEVKSHKKEIHEYLANGVSKTKLKKTIFMENVLILILSSVFSFIIYQVLRTLLIKNIQMVLPTYKMGLSVITEILVILMILFASFGISAIISYFAMDKYFISNDKIEKIDKEQEEILEETEVDEEYDEVDEFEEAGVENE